MKVFFWIIPILFQSAFEINLPVRREAAITGHDFYRNIMGARPEVRDSLAVLEILEGNVPAFYRQFIEVKTTIFDSVSGRELNASYYVAPDYLCIGSDDDWARIPMTPHSAQIIADSFNCFLPTAKMVDDIYQAATVKLEPVPMYAFRDSTVTFWHHHLIIEGQRKERSGLIAGIKKDVVLSGQIARESRPDRVAIYGWHRLDGNPIQPLYTGHVNWYVDYSHGIRLVYRKIKIDDKWLDYRQVMNNHRLRGLLCNDADCDFYHY